MTPFLPTKNQKTLSVSDSICANKCSFLTALGKATIMPVFLLAALASAITGFSQTAIINANGVNFNVPAGVTCVQVEAWGGGGGGGGVTGAFGSNRAGGGGGGGAYVRNTTVAVTSGATVIVTIGAGGTAAVSAAGGAGGTTTFASAIPVNAPGGGGGGLANSAGTANGTSGAGGVGTQNGGAGGAGVSGTAGGGGAGGAGSTGNGGNGNIPAAGNAGAAGAGGGGIGGAGIIGTGNGSNGTQPGGGGGGGRSTNATNRQGGTGGAGRVIVTWPKVTVAPASLSAICQGGTSASLTATLSGLATGVVWTDGGVGGTFSPSATSLTVTWTPPGPYSGTATLTATPSTATCGITGETASRTQVVTAQPSATISYTLAGNPFCKSFAGAASVTRTGTAGGTYTAAPAGLTINAGNGDITPSTSTAGTYTVTYTIAAAGGCTIYQTTASVTITALPTISYAGSPFCTSVTSAQPVTQTPIGYTGLYSAVLGLTLDPSTGDITPSTSASGGYSVTYTYGAYNGCAAGSTNTPVTITDAPTPSVAGGNQNICGNATATLAANTPVIGTGTWSVSSGPSTLSTQFNNTADPAAIFTPAGGEGTYTLVWTIANGTCTSASSLQVVVSAPTVTNTAVTICSLSNTNITLTASEASTFTWGIGTITGLITGANPGSGPTISDVLTNPSNSAAGSVVYNVIATSNATGCAGPSFALTVTVNPTPTITNGPTFSACSGSPASLTFTASAASTFNWTIGTITGGITGASAGGPANPMNQILTNPASTAGSVEYIVTPTGSAVGLCPGVPSTITVTVNPKPALGNYTATVCGGAATGTFGVTPVDGNPTVATIVPAGTQYIWSNPVYSPLGSISGGSAQAVPQSSISQTLTNTTNGVATATYTVTPIGPNCTGATFTVTVTVNPTPVIFNYTPTAICSGNSFSTTPTNGSPAATTIVPAGTQYTWGIPSVSPTAGSLNGTAQVSPVSAPINQALTNTTNVQQTATYTVTPATASCTGNTFTIAVPVNPRPALAAYTISPDICSGTAFSLTPVNGNPTAATIVPAGTQYTWTVPSQPASLNGTAQVAPVTAPFGQTLTNSSNTQQSAIYTVTPTAGSCSGPTFGVTVNVNPKPVIANYTATVCSGGAAFSVTPANGVPTAATIVPAGTTYTWTVASILPNPGSVNATAQATPQTSISQPLTSTSNATQTVTYTVTPAGPNCNGSTFTVTVTVNPTPALGNYSPSAVCGGTAFITNIANGIPTAATIVPAGTTYDWGVPTYGGAGTVSGGTAQTGQASISQTLTNTAPSVAAGTATYTVTPTAGTCSGSTFTVTATINPTPAPPPVPVASPNPGCGASTIAALSAPPVNVTYHWQGSNSASTVTNVPSAALSNATTNTFAISSTNTYYVRARLSTPAVCWSTATNTGVVTINPAPVAVAGANMNTCSASGAVAIYTGSSGTGTLAWSTSGTGTFANNTSAQATTATTYTPSAADISAGSVTITLTATNAPCTPATSSKTLTITPSILRFVTSPPATIGQDNTMGIIQVESYCNATTSRDVNYNGSINLTAYNGCGYNGISGQTSSAVAGLASFNSIIFTRSPQTAVQLQAAATGFTSILSTAFDVTSPGGSPITVDTCDETFEPGPKPWAWVAGPAVYTGSGGTNNGDYTNIKTLAGNKTLVKSYTADNGNCQIEGTNTVTFANKVIPPVYTSAVFTFQVAALTDASAAQSGPWVCGLPFVTVPFAGVDPSENMTIQTSLDGGATWNNLLTYTISVDNYLFPFSAANTPLAYNANAAYTNPTTKSKFTVTLPTGTTQFMFRMTAKSNRPSENWAIDNIKLTLTRPGPTSSGKALPVAIGSSLVACPSANSTLSLAVSNIVGASPAWPTYLWSPNTNLSSTTSPTPIANPAATTTYTGIVTDQDNCKDTATVDITVPSGSPGIWTGWVNNDWFQCLNWQNGVVPDNTVNVTIPSVVNLADINPASPFATPFAGIASSKNIDIYDSLYLAQNAVLNVSGNVTIQNTGKIDMTEGGLGAISNTINITGSAGSPGNWSNLHGTAGFNSGYGKVNLASTFGAQTVSTVGANETFYDLTVNNSSGVTLANDAIVTHTLTLTDGIVNTTPLAGGLLTLDVAATNPVAGSPGNSSFINGKMAKNTNTTVEFEFPVGKSASAIPYKYRPCSIEPSTTNATTYTSEYMPGSNVPFWTQFLTPLGLVNTEYWQIDRSTAGTPSPARIKLNYINPGTGFPNWSLIDPCATCNVAVVHLGASNYWDFTGLPGSFSNFAPYIEARSAASNGPVYSKIWNTFSPFGIGYDYQEVLPVQLLQFDGRLVNTDGSLNWKIANAKELGGFELQYSKNGAQFNKLADIASNGGLSYGYTHSQLTTGTHYYRLLVKEKSGKTSYSQVVLLTLGKVHTYVVGLKQTPVRSEVVPIIYSASNQIVRATITDVLGRQLVSQKGDLQTGSNQWRINTQNLAQGVYFISIFTNDGVKETIQFIKE